MKQRNIRILIFIGSLFLISSFSSCFKKGDEDPWLSFRTRMNRLTHKFWILSDWKINGSSAYTYNFLYDSLPYQSDFVFLRARIHPAGFCDSSGCIEYGTDSTCGQYTITKIWEGWDYRINFNKNNSLDINTSCYYTWDLEYDNPSDSCIGGWCNNATGFDQTVTVVWDFSDGKTEIIIKQDGYPDETYEINGLRNHDLILRREFNNEVHIICFTRPDPSGDYFGD
jgi:hypothetical protein